MTGRNKRGRFVAGNPFALLGWRGLAFTLADVEEVQP